MSSNRLRLNRQYCTCLGSTHSYFRNAGVLSKLLEFLTTSSSGCVPYAHAHTRTHAVARPVAERFWRPGSWADYRRPLITRDLQTLPGVKKKKKKKSTLGFYHKCFIISLRGGLAWSPVSAVVCVCACTRTRARRS